MKTMFTGQNSMIFMGKMRTVTDETLATYGDGRRGNRKVEVLINEGKRKKIVLRFSRCPKLDCAKKHGLMKKRCEWKVSTPSNTQTSTFTRNGSADDENLVTIVDISDPWSEIKEGKMRKLKLNKTAGLPKSSKIEKKTTYLKPKTTELANSTVFKNKEVLTKSLFVIAQKVSSLKKPKNSFRNYKVSLKRLRRNQRVKQIQTSSGIQKKVLSNPLFVVGKKTSLKNTKNSFKVYRAFKSGLKSNNSKRGIENNEISQTFQIKKARKRL